ETFRPGIVRSKLKFSRETSYNIHLQGVVAAIAFRIPEKSARKIRIGAGIRTRDAPGYVFGALRHGTWRLAHATGNAAARVAANLRRNAIGIDADKLVEAKRSDVANTKLGVAVQLLLD